MAELITKVGRYKVRDASIPLPEDGDTVELTIAEGLGYERRAAHVVFLEADEVGGAELKFARKALGLRQTELAELLGMSEFSISHMEGDRMPIQRTTQLAVAALLEQALLGPQWPPNAWMAAEPKTRPSCFEVPLKRAAG